MSAKVMRCSYIPSCKRPVRWVIDPDKAYCAHHAPMTGYDFPREEPPKPDVEKLRQDISKALR